MSDLPDGKITYGWDDRIGPGDSVWCRDASDKWIKATACSEVRIDYANLAPRQQPYRTVSVVFHPDGQPVNWPAQDVSIYEPPLNKVTS